MSSIELRIGSCPNPKYNWSNRAYVSKDIFAKFKQFLLAEGGKVNESDPFLNVSLDGWVFHVSPTDEVNGNEIGLNALQRKCGSFILNQAVHSKLFVPTSEVALAGMTLAIDLIKKSTQPKLELDCDELASNFKIQFGGQVFSINQELGFDFKGTKLSVVIQTFDHANVGVAARSSTASSQERGQLLQITNLTFKKNSSSQNNIIFTGAGATAMKNESLFRSDFDFSKMGIGGLNTQFQTMFRRAFGSRLFPGLVKQLGINHIRGILLYGPPGCGKTLIARQIGKVLNAREPKIVNGPEILDKYVGGSQEKIRALFVDAEKEQAEMGDASMLHIIIFDEMDAIMRSRGSVSDNTGVADSVVNQLLSKIDGVDSLNNILIIGMTNRKDMIDEAILRPGRLELHIEIALPDEEGRLQILNIHTASMQKSGRLDPAAQAGLPELARRTKNFTGAELEGMVRIAASYALARNTDASNLKNTKVDDVKVEWRDFERAVNESSPAFGNKDNEEIASYHRNGICNYGITFDYVSSTINKLLSQTRNSSRTPLLSVLLEGAVATGKTAIASKLCTDSDFPYVRMISAAAYIGNSEGEKCSKLLKVFSDAYKSPLSLIFIDDIERIIDYSPIGPRFSNTVLQTLLILLRKQPPPSCRLMIVATTSIADFLTDLQLVAAFQVTLHVNQLEFPEEISAVLGHYSTLKPADLQAIAGSITKPIGVKQLLLVLEMAREFNSEGSDNDNFTADEFLTCLKTVGF